MQIKCDELEVSKLYQLLVGSIVPRPIAWVSTKSVNGIDNLAPFSFFNLLCFDPPIVGFASAFKSMEPGKTPEPKDTMRNVIDTEEFVVNVVTENVAAKMNETSQAAPFEVSEFELASVTAVPSVSIKPLRVADCAISMECRLFKMVPLGISTLILGKIEYLHIADEVLGDRGVDVDKLRPVGRLGASSEYLGLNGIFHLARPK